MQNLKSRKVSNMNQPNLRQRNKINNKEPSNAANRTQDDRYLFLIRSKQIVLIPQVFSTIGLSEACDASWVQPPGLTRAPRRDTKSQRCVVHVVDNHTLVLGTVIRPPSNMCLDDVAAVEKGHLAVGTHPDLPSGMLGKDLEGGNM